MVLLQTAVREGFPEALILSKGLKEGEVSVERGHYYFSNLWGVSRKTYMERSTQR